MPSVTESLDFWDEPLPAVMLRRLPRGSVVARPVQPVRAGARPLRLRRRHPALAGLRARASGG